MAIRLLIACAPALGTPAEKPSLPVRVLKQLTVIGWGYWLRDPAVPSQMPNILQQASAPETVCMCVCVCCHDAGDAAL